MKESHNKIVFASKNNILIPKSHTLTNKILNTIQVATFSSENDIKSHIRPHTTPRPPALAARAHTTRTHMREPAATAMLTPHTPP